jgi:myo-inositol-1(or 4)-monophosphatase
MTPKLADIEALARQAGVILRAGYGRDNRVDHKGEIDLVTEIDHQAEAFILDKIRTQFPGHSIIAEESGQHGDASGPTWFIDPLDGTVNYAHGIPCFAVSIAYAEAGAVKYGAVFDPISDECFTAALGEGAWMNGQSLRASQVDSLKQALLVTGFSYDIWHNPDNNLAEFAHFALRCQGVRRLGSAALDLCYVGAGRFDGYWELDLKSWDLAAGALIATEAGATVTALDGGLEYLKPPFSLLAAGPGLHDEMLTALNALRR